MCGLDSYCEDMHRGFWDVSLDMLIAQAKRADIAVMRLLGVKAGDVESPYFIWRGGSCKICAPRNGNVYHRGVDEMPPAHPNCRCYAEPYWGEVVSSENQIEISDAQAQSKYKHASDFGLFENYSRLNAEKFKRAVLSHVIDKDTKSIKGFYRGQPVIHYYNPFNGINVMRDLRGDFISGWKLSPEQLSALLRTGRLGGKNAYA